MMRPQEAVGAVPQPGVNPMAKQAPPAPAAVAPPQASGGQQLTPDEIQALRQDPEIAQAVSLFMGRPIDPSEIPEELLANIAGMVHKLGVEGAVAEFQRIIPPEVLQQLRGAQAR